MGLTGLIIARERDAHAAQCSFGEDISCDGFLTSVPEGQRQPSPGKLWGWTPCRPSEGPSGAFWPQHVRVHFQAPWGRDTSPPGTYRARRTKEVLCK